MKAFTKGVLFHTYKYLTCLTLTQTQKSAVQVESYHISSTQWSKQVKEQMTYHNQWTSELKESGMFHMASLYMNTEYLGVAFLD